MTAANCNVLSLQRCKLAVSSFWHGDELEHPLRPLGATRSTSSGMIEHFYL